VSIVRTFGTDGCVNWSSIDPISRVVVRPQSCGVASVRSGNIHVADRGFGKAYDSSPFENKMAAIGSCPDSPLFAFVDPKAAFPQPAHFRPFRFAPNCRRADHNQRAQKRTFTQLVSLGNSLKIGYCNSELRYQKMWPEC